MERMWKKALEITSIENKVLVENNHKICVKKKFLPIPKLGAED